MNKDFEEFVKNFKPEFGNAEHIRICEQIARIREKEKLIKDKLSNDRIIKKRLVEIKKDEENILWLMNRNKK